MQTINYRKFIEYLSSRCPILKILTSLMVLNTTHLYILVFEQGLFVNGRKTETLKVFNG